MEITRIDGYSDDRFSQTVLYQHGAYLIAGEPYEVEITGRDCAVIRGADPRLYRALAEEFRFHAPQIVRFLTECGETAAQYPAAELLDVELERIQPSQFYIDEEKLHAVRTFVRTAEDVVIQVVPWEDRFISLDGHTRLYCAAQNGFSAVKAIVSETDDWVWPFVREARRRGIDQPRDLILLPHEQYTVQWDRYCDSVFAGQSAQGEPT